MDGYDVAGCFAFCREYYGAPWWGGSWWTGGSFFIIFFYFFAVAELRIAVSQCSIVEVLLWCSLETVTR